MARNLPILTTILQNAQTTGNGAVLDAADYEEITFYLRGNGSVSAGAVTLEEDVDGTASTWAAITTAITLTVGTNVMQAFHCLPGVYKNVRARISTTVTGGTVTVTAVAAQFRNT